MVFSARHRKGRRALFGVVTAVASLLASTSIISAGVRVERDVVYGYPDGQAAHLDLFRPTGRRGLRPAIVLLHSGGFCCGDKSELSSEGRRLAHLGYVAASVEYRLAPPAVFPATIRDVQSSVKWIRRHAHGLRVDTRRIGAFGDSAGGNLAALLATIGHGRQTVGSRVRVAVSYSGPMDLLRQSATSATPEYYLGCSPSQCPSRYAYASPMHHVDRTDAPLLLVNSRHELMPLDQATRMVRRMRQRHEPHRLIVLDGGRHALQYEGDVWSRTVSFLGRYLHPER
jgi:acetyl esterase/lipase